MNQVLNVDRITKRIGAKLILDDVSFTINEKEIVGFVGPNGAGKTTTFKIITNLLFADQGTITVCGHDLSTKRESALECMGSIIESPALYTNMSGLANLRLAAGLRNIKKERIDEIISLIAIGSAIDRSVKTYSLGMKQRLMLGMCLLPKPRLLLLDEPTNGLDPTGSLEFRQTIMRYAQENQTAVLISSHLLHDLQQMCDRYIFIKDGRIIKETVNQPVTVYLIQTPQAERLVQLLNSISETAAAIGESRVRIRLDQGLTIKQLIDIISQNDIIIQDLTSVTDHIEAQYAELFL
ncbi:MAG: ABC transporter ATP-binding protein [Erysipelotrichaceae bacterium]|nr:ABC transporter ATP-binding protein [Erysipelotrichaceae bacterium]